jgi:hypothetical protein
MIKENEIILLYIFKKYGIMNKKQKGDRNERENIDYRR